MKLPIGTTEVKVTLKCELSEAEREKGYISTTRRGVREFFEAQYDDSVKVITEVAALGFNGVATIVATITSPDFSLRERETD